MTQPATSYSGGAAPLSLPQRFLGILFSPRSTFESVVSWPRWAGMLLVTTLLITTFMGGLMLTEVGRQAFLDAMAERMSPQQLQAMGGRVEMFIYIQIASILILSPIMALVFAGILLGVFAVTGGTASFKQVLAVVVHAGVISTVAGAFSAVLNYFRENLSSPTNLAVFAPGVDEGSFLGGFLGTLDLGLVWWLFVLAIGLGVLYRRRTQPIFLSLLTVYALIAAAVGSYKAAFGGS